MANLVENKYSLKTIHDEIDLYDRKLAHMTKYDTFATDADRDAAVRKLTLKRELLVTTAKRMVADGVEFKENDLPRSFRPKDAPVEAVEVPADAAKAEAPAFGEKRSVRRQASAFAGTSLDWEQSVKHYMEKKAKA
ncbi:MAG: hypothetical protein V4555_11105 [Acidobacteriota bacterium]